MVVTRREGIGLALLATAQMFSFGMCAALPALPLAASNDKTDTLPDVNKTPYIRATTLGRDNTTVTIHNHTTTSSHASNKDRENQTKQHENMSLLPAEARMYRYNEDFDNSKSLTDENDKRIYRKAKFVPRSDKEVWDLFQKRKEYYINSIGKHYNNINRTGPLHPSFHNVKPSQNNNAIVRFPDIENSVSNVYAAVGEYSDQIGGPSNTFENIDPSTFVLVDLDRGVYRPNDEEHKTHRYTGLASNNVDRFDNQIVDDGKILSSYGAQQDEPDRVQNVMNSDDKLDDDDNLNQFINISFLNVTDANDDDRLEVEKTKNVLRTVVKKVLGLYHETSGSLTASHSMKLDGKTYHTAVALSFGKPYKHKITEVPFSASNEELADSPSQHVSSIHHSPNKPIHHGDEQQDNTSVSEQDPSVAEQETNMSEENTSAADHAAQQMSASEENTSGAEKVPNVSEQQASGSEENTSIAEPSLVVETQHTSIAEENTSIAEQDTSRAEQNSNSNEGGSSGPSSVEGSKSAEENDDDDRNVQNDETHNSREHDQTTPSSTTQNLSTEPLRSNSKLTRKPSTNNFFTTESSNAFPVDVFVPLKPIQKPSRTTTTSSPLNSYEEDVADNDSDKDVGDYLEQNFAFVTPKPKPVKPTSQRKPTRGTSTVPPADLIIEMYSNDDGGSEVTNDLHVDSKPNRKPPTRDPDTYKIDGGLADNDLEVSKESFEYGTIASTTTSNQNQVSSNLGKPSSKEEDVFTNRRPILGDTTSTNTNKTKNCTDSYELDSDSDDCDDDDDVDYDNDDEYYKDKSDDDITVDSYEATGDSTSIDYDSIQYDSIGDYDSGDLHSLEKGGYRSVGDSVEDGSNYGSDEDDGYRELRSKTEVVLMNDTKTMRTMDDGDEEGYDVANELRSKAGVFLDDSKTSRTLDDGNVEGNHVGRTERGNGRRNTRFMNGTRRRLSKNGRKKEMSSRTNNMVDDVGDLESKGKRMMKRDHGKTARKRRRSRRKNEGLVKDVQAKNEQVLDLDEKLRELSKISKVTL